MILHNFLQYLVQKVWKATRIRLLYNREKKKKWPLFQTLWCPRIIQVEIGHLKARQSGLQEDVQKLQRSVQSASAGPVLPVTTASSSIATSSYLSHPSASHHHHHGFHGDDMDLSEVISSQQEINRLATEVLRLEAEVAHWRRMSQVKMMMMMMLTSWSVG